jgi:carbamoyltransferase
MNVLGIGGSVHDFSCCLVVDGTVVVAIEEERLSRVKYHPLGRISTDQFRLRGIQYCLDAAGLTLDDVDQVVGNDLIFPAVLRGLPDVRSINHHLSHAASSFYLSPHAEAAVLVMDGFGSMADGRAETASHFLAGDDGIRLLHRDTGAVVREDQRLPFSWANFDFVEDSAGVLYSHVTDLIGFGEYEEGKTMGLAAYGKAGDAAELGHIVLVDDEGRIRFGRAERDALDAVHRAMMAAARTDADVFAVRAAFAAAVQSLLEEVVLRQARSIHERTGADALCVSGGVFMNCPANYRLVTEGPFREVFLHGACGDNGTAIGAALHGYHTGSGLPRTPMTRPVTYTGRTYGEDDHVRALEKHPDRLVFRRSPDIAAETAEVLAAGGVVGWFQGGSEFGARALGNRSILADPRDPGIKDKLNLVVKGREAFRPFAPSVLFERQGEYYDITVESTHMCLNAMSRADGPPLPGVTHVDGSARIQSVRADVNPLYHRLISRFAELTGVGVVLNTSFNEREPIVETPEQAVDCFLRTDIDRLALGPFMVSKA